MAPRARKKKAGLTREDAARDAMRKFGFAERLITVCIKELLEVYGEGGWFLIEDCSYMVLLNKCLEHDKDKQQEEMAEEKIEEIEQEQQTLQLEDEEMTEEQNDKIVDQEAEQEDNDEMVEEAEPEQTPQLEEEKVQQVEDGRDHVGSNSTSQVGCVAETGTQTCQTEALSITSQTDVLDSSQAVEASVIDHASPAAFPSTNASGGCAQHSVQGAKSFRCGGWLSDDSDSDPDLDKGSDGDDDEIIQLTPQPLCEELEELIKEVRGEKKKRKKPTRWED